MDKTQLVIQIAEQIVGWPLMLYVIGVSIICTVVFQGVQFRYFFRAWRCIFAPPATPSVCGPKRSSDMTPLQAFINTLSSNLGNGSIAGMATAVYAGGPGSALWVMIFGILMMSVRFAEVYISTLYGARATKTAVLGGPMLYLQHVVGGKALAWCYALLCCFFGLIIGNAMQANSIRVSIVTTWNVPTVAVAIVLFAFIVYVLLGGAQRIIAMSDRIVPLKVATFFLSTGIVLIYHYARIPDALYLICTSAFQPLAVVGGVVGFSVQQAIRYGMVRSIMATESGLGTAAILFGFTESQNPMHDGLMSMVSTFISTIVCFLVALCILVSGVWNNGLNSTAMTIAAFDTVFGHYGGWIVSFLSITFGIGVTVTYAYIVRAAWLFLTKGRWPIIFSICYSLAFLGGALADVTLVWSLGDIVNAGMLLINLFGILCLLPRVRKDFITAMRACAP